MRVDVEFAIALGMRREPVDRHPRHSRLHVREKLLERRGGLERGEAMPAPFAEGNSRQIIRG